METRTVVTAQWETVYVESSAGRESVTLFVAHDCLHSALPLPGDAVHFLPTGDKSRRHLGVSRVKKHRRAAENTSPCFEFPKRASGSRCSWAHG